MGYVIVVDPVISFTVKMSPVSRLLGQNYEVNLRTVWKCSDIWKKGYNVGTLKYGNILYHSLFKLYVQINIVYC